jgi:hypothetical protein
MKSYQCSRASLKSLCRTRRAVPQRRIFTLLTRCTKLLARRRLPKSRPFFRMATLPFAATAALLAAIATTYLRLKYCNSSNRWCRLTANKLCLGWCLRTTCTRVSSVTILTRPNLKAPVGVKLYPKFLSTRTKSLKTQCWIFMELRSLSTDVAMSSLNTRWSLF